MTKSFIRYVDYSEVVHRMSASSLDKIMSWLNDKRAGYVRVYQKPALDVSIQQMGKIRIETVDDLINARLGELPQEVSILYMNTFLDRVDNAIGKEKDAIDDYAELENQYRDAAKTAEKAGNTELATKLRNQADIVKEIRDDEVDHLEKFTVMRRWLTEGMH